MKRLIRDEKGQALVLVLILLLVSGLIIAPLLAYMGSGLIAGRVYEKRTAELYAADAGVEDAVWKIQHQAAGVWNLTKCYPSTNYTITNVNGKNVTVTITYLINEPVYPTYHYRVVSTATGDGSGTQIEAYIASVYGDYSGITNHVITSQNEIDLKGEVYYPEGSEPVEYYGGDWPTAEELAQFYWQYVEDGTHYYSDTEIDLAGVDRELGPLYVEGALTIENSKSPEATLTLTGTIFITGDTTIEPTQNLIIDLNGHTIFVESDSQKPPKEALYIKGPKVTIIGPGTIIAVGDVHFEPDIPAGMTDPLFIMSVEGTTTLMPGGDFYGSVAGSVEVELYPGTSLNYPEEGFEDLNFPGCSGAQLVYSIASWDINQQ